MNNLLIADFYRIFKSKTLRNSMIILSLFLIMIIGNTTLKLSEFTFVGGMLKNGFHGFTVGLMKSGNVQLSVIRGSLIFTIIISVMMLFIVADSIITPYNNGTIKNMVAYGENRKKLYLSKFITINTVIISLSLITFLTSLIGGSLALVKGFFEKEYILLILKILPVLYLAMMAMTSFYIVMAVIIRKKSTITSLGIIFITFIATMIMDVIPQYLKSKIPIFMLQDICGDPSRTALWGTYIINSILIIIASIIIGIFIFNNQDI